MGRGSTPSDNSSQPPNTPVAIRQAVIRQPATLGWRQVHLPAQPARGWIRARVRLSLISPGTELRLYHGQPAYAGLWAGFARLDQATTSALQTRPHQYEVSPVHTWEGPIFPVGFGYNSVGEVTAVGEGVDQLAVGDRVFALARHQQAFDVPDWKAIKIPDQVSDQAAVFSYIATLGLHALRAVSFQPGENVAIIGLGLVGLATALTANACGARLVLIDRNAPRRELAARMTAGALVVDPSDPEFAGKVQQAVAPEGVDIVIEAGRGAASLRLALRLADTGGRIAVVALHPEDAGDLFAHDFHIKTVTLVGTGNDPNEDPRLRGTRFTMSGNIAYILDLQRRGLLDLDGLETHRFPASAIDKAMASLANGDHSMIGVTLDWS